MKKYALPSDIRAQYAAKWAKAFQQLQAEFLNNQLHAAEFCAKVLELIWRERFGEKFHNGKSQSRSLPWRLKFVSDTVPQVLDRWSQNEIGLVLLFEKPSVQTVLSLQAQGLRVVSLLISEKEIREFQEGERDFASFLIHDLLHASHFFASERQEFQRQVQFSKWMQALFQRQVWQQATTENPKLQEQLEYLVSDMNTHTWHLIKTLKSLLDQHHLDSLEPRVLEPLPVSLKSLWPLVNTEHENEPMIQNFLDKMLQEPLLEI